VLTGFTPLPLAAASMSLQFPPHDCNGIAKHVANGGPQVSRTSYMQFGYRPIFLLAEYLRLVRNDVKKQPGNVAS